MDDVTRILTSNLAIAVVLGIGILIIVCWMCKISSQQMSMRTQLAVYQKNLTELNGKWKLLRSDGSLSEYTKYYGLTPDELSNHNDKP